MNYLKTPILITAWNRPEKVRILINSLKVFKPENLYFHAMDQGMKTLTN